MSKMSKFFKHPLISIADSIYKRRTKTVVVQKKLAAKVPAKKPAVKAQTNKPVVIENRIFHNIQLKDEVALYFDGGMGNIYQIEQWLGPLSELAKVKSFIFIVRKKQAFDWIKKNTNFQVVYCRLIDNVMQVYEQGQFKCVLYVNNGQKNFQSLITRDALHVHINHGESDKLSTISNQAKAYDYVFIVGPAAYDKYRNNLLNKDMNRFIKIGRPQLEYIEKVSKPDVSKKDPTISNENLLFGNSTIEDRKIVLYAPTWEATHESMNYTSLNEYGTQIVDMILEDPSLYLIYKPHPNTGSRSIEIGRINDKIIKCLKGHFKAHVVIGGDINSLYQHVDLAIFDNSAVAIDYLATDKPMLMTDIFYKTKDRNDKPFITNGAIMINGHNFSDFMDIVHREITEDTLRLERDRVKQYFLGDVDYLNKESTKNFIESIEMVCDERDKALENLTNIQENSDPTL